LKPFHFTVIIAIALLLFAGFNRWGNFDESPNIATDGQGYHAYLPAVFIYQDLQFSFVDSINKQYYPVDKRAYFIVENQAGNVNKYFAGTALMQTPFFLAGCALSWILGNPVDGYSWPFHLMVGVAAIFYLVLGIWLLSKTLLNMEFGKWPAMAAVAAVLFGTNLLYYTLYEPSMSHVYSFFTVSAFLFSVHTAIHKNKNSAWIFAALTLGLTVLIRPTNAVIVLGIPAIAGGGLVSLTAVENLFRNKRILLVSILAFMAAVVVQPLIYFIQTGMPFVWAYGKEGFDFASPEIFNVLLSYQKGLFVYAPVLFLAVAGMFSAISQNKPRYTWLLLFLGAATWIISSWWMWFYGGSFGQRSFIEYLPFLAIGLAYAFRSGWGMIKPPLFYIAGFLLVGVTLVQTYQYVKHIIPFNNMNKHKYWSLFLRTGEDLAWYYSPNITQNTAVLIDSVVVKHNMEISLGWNNENFTQDEKYAGNSASKMRREYPYGISFRKPTSELELQPDMIRVSAQVLSNSRSTDLTFVCSLEDSTGTAYFWAAYPLRPQFKGVSKWSYASALFQCGVPRHSTDVLSVYPMKSDDATVYIDNLKISLITAKYTRTK